MLLVLSPFTLRFEACLSALRMFKIVAIINAVINLPNVHSSRVRSIISHRMIKTENGKERQGWKRLLL